VFIQSNCRYSNTDYEQNFIDTPYIAIPSPGSTMERPVFEAMSVAAQTQAIKEGVYVIGRYQVRHEFSNDILKSVIETNNLIYDQESGREQEGKA